jgi:alcohol dehydrogenase class IV
MQYLPRAVEDGSDMEARERMHNGATCAGLGFGNAMASLSHAMGHAFGASFHVPHGRAVGLFLPYTIEFAAGEAPERFADLAQLLRVAEGESEAGARTLGLRVRRLALDIDSPTSVAELGIERAAYEAKLEKMIDDAFNDTQMVTAPRCPTYDELERLFLYAFEGLEVDF